MLQQDIRTVERRTLSKQSKDYIDRLEKAERVLNFSWSALEAINLYWCEISSGWVDIMTSLVPRKLGCMQYYVTIVSPLLMLTSNTIAAG